MPDDSITVYADYACPFCYLGRASLDRYREQRDDPLAVEWHPFDLLADRRDESGQLVEPSNRSDEYMNRAWENVQRLAADYDVPIPDEPLTDTDSRPAQLLSVFVQREHPDAWLALDEALYDAIWVDQRDVADPDVLEALATGVGLDAAVVETALRDDALEATLEERFAAARQHGVTGVPTFVVDGQAARGAVAPDRLRELVEEGG